MTDLFEELADNAPVMIWRSDLEGGCDYFNKPWLAFTGRDAAAECGLGWATGVHPDDYDRCLKIYSEAFEARRSFTMEYRLRRHDGAYRWILDNGAPFFRDGGFAGYFGSCVDITDRKALEQDWLLLIAELDHRVKNILSVVQSLARQSRDRGTTPGTTGDLLEGRLMALSQAHEALAEQQWTGGELGGLVERIGRLSDRDLGRIAIEGDPVLLPPEIAQSVAMAMHELCINARQHGALSAPAGRVSIRWRRERTGNGDCVRLDWQEKGGPAIKPPSRQGLGLRVLRSMLPVETGGAIEVDFPASGLVCHIRVPVQGGGR